MLLNTDIDRVRKCVEIYDYILETNTRLLKKTTEEMEKFKHFEECPASQFTKIQIDVPCICRHFSSHVKPTREDLESTNNSF